MANTRLILVDNHESVSAVRQEQAQRASRFAVQRILGLCDLIATHYPQTKVVLIIQGSNHTEDIEVEKTTSTVRSEGNGELDALIESLRHDFGTEPKVSEQASISFNHSESVREDEDKENENRPLTEKEREIVKYIACGKTNKEIAYILGIKEQTVKSHVSSVLRKLHASDRAHSVALAIHNGFL